MLKDQKPKKKVSDYLKDEIEEKEEPEQFEQLETPQYGTLKAFQE